MDTLKDLAQTSKQEQIDFLDSFDEVLCDLDGVLWLFSHIYEGSDDCIKALKKLGKKVHFVSNNCTQTVVDYIKRFHHSGLAVEEDDLVIPTVAIIDFLKEKNFDKEIFLIGLQPLRSELESAGFKVMDKAPASIKESAEAFVMSSMEKNEKVGAVIIDFDLNVNFVALQRAINYLRDGNVLFISAANERILPIMSNVYIGPKYFLQPVEDVSGRQSLEFGKPGAEMNKFIVKKFGIKDPKRVLFIGDMISQDMNFAYKYGYQKLLVLTGVTTRRDIENWKEPEEYKPEYVIEGLGQLCKIIENVKFNNKL